jgi:hypothetical protein
MLIILLFTQPHLSGILFSYLVNVKLKDALNHILRDLSLVSSIYVLAILKKWIQIFFLEFVLEFKNISTETGSD